MIRKELNGIQWLEFELLANCPEVSHAVVTRHGGHSQDHLASLNLGTNVGDNPEHIQANFQKLKNTFSLSEISSGRICHGITISDVTPSSSQNKPFCDGLATQSPNIPLMITQADCQAAIFYDPIQHVLANIHCGWRGNVQNIYQQTVFHMQKNYLSKPENILVCISPSLGPENSEFINYKTELPESFLNFQIKPLYFDFWAISESQLIQSGILPHHIQIAKIDTFANSQDYFSFRRNNKCGRQATICSLNL